MNFSSFKISFKPNSKSLILKSQKKEEPPFSDLNFSRLFEEYYEPLCRYVMKFTGDKVSAEDIVQEQYVNLWENREKLESIHSFKSYLYTSVKNRSISYLRKLYSKENKFVMELLSESEKISNLPGPSEILESKELELIIEKALDSLPEKCRIIFTMKKFGELSNKEVADKLNISVKTVEAQTTIAIKKLMAYISSNYLILLLFFIKN